MSGKISSNNKERPGVLFGYLSKEYRGGVKFQLDFARAFQYFRVGFITSNEEVTYEEQVREVGTIHRIPPTKHFIRRIRAMRELAKEYDILYLNKTTLNPFELMIVKAAGFRKVIFHSHSTGKDCGNPLIKAVWYGMHYISRSLAVKMADRLYACSPEAGRWLYGRSGADQVTVIPNGVDVDLYRFDPDVRQTVREELSLSGFTVIHVGAFSPVKNQAYLAEAFSIFNRSHPDSQLLFVGGGPLMRQVQSKAAELGLEGAVRFLGQRKDVARLLQGADVFVLPSVTEGLPFSAVEAQAAGLPCILTAAASAASGILPSCEFFDVSRPAAELADRICQAMIYDRRDEGDRLIEAGFDVNSSARKLEEQLLELLSETDHENTN